MRWIGTVTGNEVGICLVEVAAGQLRASWGSRLLADVARDRARAPRAGDQVVVMLWPDERVTVEGVLTRGAASTPRLRSVPD